MKNADVPLWRSAASQYRRPIGAALRGRVAAALASNAVRMQRELLATLGLELDETPVLWKQLPGGLLRLFFSVEGAAPAIEEGQIVALVLLHDLQRGEALYAHAVHAGPEANPLLKHQHGPMANPKAQAGVNGERATLRLLEHKRAIWDKFLAERDQLGADQAGRNWRDRYLWSLVRLYYCERCPGCRWGSPFYDGIAGQQYRQQPPTLPRRVAPGLAAELFDRLRESSAWEIESAYAGRGGFRVDSTPVLATALEQDMFVAAFPTTAEFVEAGTLVGLTLYADVKTAKVRHVHVLTAGPEPELALLHGRRALGLPSPQPGQAGAAAREQYVRWRRRAWSEFWLRELEEGLHAASGQWLVDYWNALGRLFRPRG